MGEGGDSDGVGDESGNDLVGSQSKGVIPVAGPRSKRAGVHPCRSDRERRSPGGGVFSG